jgi:hypothetical protein
VDRLPWDAVTPVAVGDEHPEKLDQTLVDAITTEAQDDSMPAKARAASLAFLYLYMTLSHDGHRSVLTQFDRLSPFQ